MRPHVNLGGQRTPLAVPGRSMQVQLLPDCARLYPGLSRETWYRVTEGPDHIRGVFISLGDRERYVWLAHCATRYD